jgi:NADPH:quinone reductase-like Zn-dependent oxidoreductase
MISNELVVRGFWMSPWMQRATQEQRVAAMQRVFELALNGELPLAVHDVYPLSDAHKALRAAETPGRHGKVLFRP